MSDNFMMLVDQDVSLVDAPAVSADVITAFRERKLITGELTQDCVLGGSGFRLGPAVPTIYSPRPNEGRFWELMTSGVEPSIARTFNHWALGPSCEYFACPHCKQKHDLPDSPVWDSVFEAVGHWHEQDGNATVLCPSCGVTAQLTAWDSRPPLGFGNLSFRFWNWPPFNLPAWKLDIPALVSQITGHTIVISWGRV